MNGAVWFLLGMAYPVSVTLAARWLDFVQTDERPDNRLPPAVGLLSPFVLAVALVWLLCFSQRKAGRS